MKRLLSSLLASVAILGLSGCAGYHIGPVIPKMMEGVQTIAVPTFENDTLVPRLEVLAANSVIKQIQQDGTFKIVREADADVVLAGKVVSIVRKSSRSVRGDVFSSREYTLTVTVAYEVDRRSTGETIDRGTIAGRTSFFVSGNDVNQDERQAVPLALEDAAVNLVSRLSEGW